MVMVHPSCHGLFPRQPSVIEGMHVDDLLSLDDDGRLRLLLETALALEGCADLIHHGAAEGLLDGRQEGRWGWGVRDDRWVTDTGDRREDRDKTADRTGAERGKEGGRDRRRE